MTDPLDEKGLEAAAVALSGAPFPTKRSLAKAEASIRAYLAAAPQPMAVTDEVWRALVPYLLPFTDRATVTDILRQAPVVSNEWQDMSSAPNDGTEIILWGTMRGHKYPWKYIGHYFNPYSKDGWWVAHSMPVAALCWAPLPATPDALSTKEQSDG